MQRSSSYSFQHQQPQQQQQQQATQIMNNTRYSAAHNTSSAFSASANPNEDWTKISDLAERRRIQNRIAQRNYRKKLKRRLEDLERKAASTSTSPEPSHVELVESTTQKQLASSPNNKSMARQPSGASSTYSHDAQLSPELFPLEDPFANGTLQEGQFTFDSSPQYTYSHALPASDCFSADFNLAQSQTVPQMYADSYFQPDYLHPLPQTLPTMGLADCVKQDAFFTDEDLLNPYGMPFGSFTSLDLPYNQMHAEALSRSSLSSDGWSLSDSQGNSPPYFAHQPSTPLSRSTSPNIHFFDQAWR